MNGCFNVKFQKCPQNKQNEREKEPEKLNDLGIFDLI